MFFTVQEHGIEGRFEINTKDLRDRFGVQIDDGGNVIEQLRADAPRMQAYLREHASIGANGQMFPLEFTKTDLFEEWKNGWVQYYFRIPNVDVPDLLDIRFNIMFEFDRRHRNLVLVEYDARTGKKFPYEQVALVFGPHSPVQQLDLRDIPKPLRGRQMVVEGVWHIWMGIDHILFIVAFLLTTVLVWNREKSTWVPVPNFGRALSNVLTLITVFTIAHSITLGLAALGYVWISSRLVESAIALSIILVAMGNFLGSKRQLSIAVIFFLGLFHGLGFASVLGHLPFRMVNALRNVLLFNVGVELGQIAIVMTLFPILFLLRKNQSYPTLFMRGVSASLALVAGYWFVQRAFALG